jgi:hypothetical protein
MARFAFYVTYSTGRVTSAEEEFPDLETAVLAAKGLVEYGGETAVGRCVGNGVEWLGAWRRASSLMVWERAE